MKLKFLNNFFENFPINIRTRFIYQMSFFFVKLKFKNINLYFHYLDDS